MRWFLLLWRWLFSRAYRTALDEHRRTRSQLRRQRDLIDAEAFHGIDVRLAVLRRTILAAGTPAEVKEARDRVRAFAYEHLEDPRRSRVKDATELLLTATVLIMTVRAFFVEPMQVPTGSMQPTLYGVTFANRLGQPGAARPPWWQRFWEGLVFGRTYYHLVAEAPGRLVNAEPPQPVRRWLAWLPTLRHQRFQIGEVWYSVWLPKLELPNPLNLPPALLFIYHAGVDPDREYQPGEDLVRLAVTTGDHLLIDRFSVNFARPSRGEIIVFRSDALPSLNEKTHYIKRLIAFGGETVQLGDDRHVRINDRRLDGNTPGFERIYSFSGRPRDSQYSGHLNDAVAARRGFRPGFLAPLFKSGETRHRVKDGHVFVLGDNTVASLDSRRFGDLPESAVVGRLLGVYWPLSPRFGFAAQ